MANYICINMDSVYIVSTIQPSWCSLLTAHPMPFCGYGAFLHHRLMYLNRLCALFLFNAYRVLQNLCNIQVQSVEVTSCVYHLLKISPHFILVPVCYTPVQFKLGNIPVRYWLSALTGIIWLALFGYGNLMTGSVRKHMLYTTTS